MPGNRLGGLMLAAYGTRMRGTGGRDLARGSARAVTGSRMDLSTIATAVSVCGRALSPLVQVIGMMVGVYAFGYSLLARDSRTYPASCGWAGALALRVDAYAGAAQPEQKEDSR